MQVAIGIILGGLITIATTMIVEYLRRPSLRLFIEAPPADRDYRNRPAQTARFLRLILRNNPLPFLARWMQRAPALQCRGAITFHHLDDGQNIFGRTMAVRWVSSPEAVPVEILGPTGERYHLIDPTRLTIETRIDVYPGENELLDVAVRFDDEEDCYGWNNEGYFSNWRNPRFIFVSR